MQLSQRSTLWGNFVSGSARYFNIELNENDVQLDDLSEYQQLANDGVLRGLCKATLEWIKNVS